MKVKVEINNYGLIKHFDYEFESGNLYFLKGSNEQGKTTFTRAVLENANGLSKNKNRLSFGEKEGNVKSEYILNGADGNKYTVNLEFDDKGKEKFTIITPDNVVSRKKTDISKIFQYNHFTVDDWFGWGLTAEGRRKQADILKLLLPQGKRDRIQEINDQINTKNGILYIQRRDLNNKLSSYVDYEFSERDQKVLTNGEHWITALEGVKENYDKIKDIVSNNEIYKEQLKSTNKFIDNNNNSIEDYKKKIAALESEKEKYHNNLKDIKSKIKDVPNSEEIEKTKEAVEQYQNGINEYHVLTKQKENNDKIKDVKLSEQNQLMGVEKQLKDLRKENKDIISSDIKVNNVVINDGEVFYVEDDNELPFIEDNISYSKGGKIVLKIMAIINSKLPMWLIGKAAEYDNKSKEELLKIAKEYNGIIVADKVIEEDTELCIEVYDKTGANEKPKEERKEIF